MRKFSILEHPNDFLRRKCKPVKGLVNTKRVRQMFKLMYENGGMGLAASQIGWNARVFVMNITRDREQELVFVNPTIVIASDETVKIAEGCLSFPGMVGDVERPVKVLIHAQDINGQYFHFEDDQWGARCAQHEIDHLDGVLLIDVAEKLYEGEDPL
jgi:peptide deformylase